MFDTIPLILDSLSTQVHLLLLLVFFLMAVESSFFPLPSEIVMIPAGVLAHTLGIPIGVMILLGGLGSVVGAAFNYVFASLLGVPAVMKFGAFFGVTEAKYKKSEALFLKNALLYTFLGRLIPVVRQFISLPAGAFLMRPVPFALATFVGATIWSAVLVMIGYLGALYGPALMHELEAYLKYIGLVILAITGLYIIRIWYKIQFSK